MPKKKSKPRVSPEEVRARLYKTRSRVMYGNHVRRAKSDGQWLDYTLEELRYLISAALRRGTCPYCQGELTAANFGGDHKHPLSRGGKHCHANLLVSCMDCNAAKGALDFFEFRELMAVLGNWRPEVRTNTLARLKAGARLAKLPPLPPDLLAGNDDRRRGKIEDCDDRRRAGPKPAKFTAEAHHTLHERRAAAKEADAPTGPGSWVPQVTKVYGLTG